MIEKINISTEDNLQLFSLEHRLHIKEEEKNQIFTVNNGEQGENNFSLLLKEIPSVEALWDFQLNKPDDVQYDFIVCADAGIFIFEVKNYKGNWNFNGNHFSNQYNRMIKSPYQQLERALYYFESFLKAHAIKSKVYHYVVYVNPTFTCYDLAPYKSNTILPTELWKLKTLLKSTQSTNNQKLASFIKSKNQRITKYDKPMKEYNVYTMLPGFRCTNCRAIFSTEALKPYKKQALCPSCFVVHKTNDLAEDALLELYYCKGKPFTFREALWWLEGISRDKLYKILKLRFLKIGSYKNAKYQIKK